MGVMKRIQGWRDSRWPIPNTLQALVGLIELRDPEAYLERKRAERESARERAAIQWEGRSTSEGRKIRTEDGGESRLSSDLSPSSSVLPHTGPSLESMRAEVERERAEATVERESRGTASVQGRLF